MPNRSCFIFAIIQTFIFFFVFGGCFVSSLLLGQECRYPLTHRRCVQCDCSGQSSPQRRRRFLWVTLSYKWQRHDWIRNTLIPRGNWAKTTSTERKSDIIKAWTLLYAVTLDGKEELWQISAIIDTGAIIDAFIHKYGSRAACSDAQCGRRNRPSIILINSSNICHSRLKTLGLESYPYASLRSPQVLLFFVVCVLSLQCLSFNFKQGQCAAGPDELLCLCVRFGSLTVQICLRKVFQEKMVILLFIHGSERESCMFSVSTACCSIIWQL